MQPENEMMESEKEKNQEKQKILMKPQPLMKRQQARPLTQQMTAPPRHHWLVALSSSRMEK